ncbi:hypothetical protein K431DRAFT_310984 [Polychaeton citri CBS 116435]|uniref:N-acetylglucosamine-induced protein 1 n=1 Tax=Polychaeton citri CBS 116435 TaxID=1314669 RepID=A0A9P4QD96_9PEZI|nr:hypothetical protein K431DRAFT_310984 [Polychaeton citri CBS 116435]
MSKEDFWNTNLPAALHTPACPSYLQYAFSNPKDRQILSTPDAAYQRQTWEEVQDFIKTNRIDMFQRVPSQLRLYREYCDKLVGQYGSVMRFVVEERLGWSEHEGEREGGFGCQDNYKILLNDWPYGVDERIVHLVIWTKFPLPVDHNSELGDLTVEGRQMIDEFVDRKFVSKCGSDRTIWFKNWSSLKSIHAVEHLHVMLFDPDREFIKEVTHADVALAEKVAKGEA